MDSYDYIIIGGGGTGLASAMYAARLGLKTLVLGHSHGSELPIGGVITTTDVVENYPGFIKLTGQELAKKLEDHARDYELVTIKSELAEEISKNKDCFEIKTKKSNYKSKSILFATGTKWRKLPEKVKGAREFEHKGINYCALCDGPLYKDKDVAIVGGSDGAAKDALLLSKYAKRVYMIYRGKEIHPEPINYERIKNEKKIEVINETNIEEIQGSKFVEKIILDNEKELEVQGVFVSIGHEVLSSLAEKLKVKLNKKKEIKINHEDCSTNVKGIFAAGDVTNTDFKQLITGVSQGCTASHSAYEYIAKKHVETC